MLTSSCKRRSPGAQALRTVDLSLIFSEELGDLPEPYERLLGDALKGDPSLFTREDSVEETWRIVQPLLDAPPPVEPYAKGSWGRPAQTGCWRGTPGGVSPGCIRMPCVELLRHCLARSERRDGQSGRSGELCAYAARSLECYWIPISAI